MLYRTVCLDCKWFSGWYPQEVAEASARSHLERCGGPCVTAERDARGQGKIFWRPSHPAGALRQASARFRDPTAREKPAPLL